MEDPVLPAHHVRIAKQLYTDVKDKLTGIAGIVVKHNDTEGEHIHVYLKHDKPMTSKSAKVLFRTAYGISRKLTNGDWSWSDPKNIEGFWAYAMSGYKQKGKHQFDGYARQGAECVYWGLPETRMLEYPTRPEAPIVSTMPMVVVEKRSKLPLKEQFLKHCYAVYEGNQEYVSKDKILREFIRWSKYGYSDYQIIPCVRYAYYSINDTDEIREILENDAIANLISKI